MCIFIFQWAEAIESLEHGNPGSEKSFGMKLRPDADVEIDEKFWEDNFDVPCCNKCNGLLKPDVCMSWMHSFKMLLYIYRLCCPFVLKIGGKSFILKVVFFGDNVPKDRATEAMNAAKGCDSFLVLGSSLMTFSAFRLARYIKITLLIKILLRVESIQFNT